MSLKEPGAQSGLSRWRKAIAAGLHSDAAGQLRGLVWEKLEPHLAANTATVYLCPEGPLSALPWPALPGQQKGTVLLERYAFALVPHGHALLEGLRDRPADRGPGALLALGGVAYDDAPAQGPSAPPGQPAAGAPASGGPRLSWPKLPGTGKEADGVLALARRLDPRPERLHLSGQGASTAELLQALPKARWAHLATHGFFAAPQSDVRKELLDDRLFQMGFGRERRGVGARNPLTQTGLVLAGANRSAQKAESDRGILTAEALAGLDLSGLRLAVLSACETGLGEAAADGGGVFGLQRAFHLGGCRDMVASFWRVDDEPTAALMQLFYYQPWEKGQPPLQALRQAQLALYRNPTAIPDLARLRGPELRKKVHRVAQAAERPAAGLAGARAPVRHWAAFVLSGPGQYPEAVPSTAGKGRGSP